MFKKLGAFALGFTFLLAGCGKEKATLEARWHFVGADGLRGPGIPAEMKRLLTAPRALEVGDRMATNSADAIGKWVAGGAAADPAINAALLPLVRDLLSHESEGEIWRTASGGRQVAVAVRVTKDHAETWVKSWTALWSKLSHGSALVSVSADQGWLFAVSDLHDGLLPDFKKLVLEKPLAPGTLFTVDGGTEKVPSFHVDVTTPKGKVRTAAHFSAPFLAVPQLAEWNVPTNIARDPVIAFSALRGLGPQLFDSLGLSNLVSDQKLGQVFTWGHPDSYFETSFAVEMTDPVRFGAQVANSLLPHFQAANGNSKPWSGQLYMDTNTHSITMATGVLNPVLLPVKSATQKYAIISFFPPPRKTSVMAPELLAEITKPGTLYYDWEITSENTSHWGALLSSMDAVRSLVPPGSKSAAQQWLWGCSTNMGNTATRLTQPSPGEFDFVRNSDAGFTGLELVLFSRWIDPPTTVSDRRRKAPGLPGLPK